MAVTKLALFTVGRSGSQFVYHLLDAYAAIQVEEWLRPDWGRGDASSHEFLVYIRNRLMNPYDPFSLKVTPDVFNPCWADCQILVHEILSATRFAKQLFLYRLDFWGLCQSYWRALNSGIWHSNQAPQDPSPADFLLIASNLLDAELKMQLAYRQYAPSSRAAIAYEQLLSSPAAFSAAILGFLEGKPVSAAGIRLAGLPERLKVPASMDCGEISRVLEDIAILNEFQAIKEERNQNLSEFLASVELL